MISIRPYRADDLKIVGDISAESFGENNDKEALKFLVSDSQHVTSVAELNKKVVGFTILRVKPQAYLTTLAVASGSRKKGIGEQLLTAVETQAAANGDTMLFVEIHPKYSPQKWYEKYGYYVVRELGLAQYKDGATSKLLAKGLYWGEVRVGAETTKKATTK